MNTYIPTIEDIYMVSYITIHGWKLNYDGRWEKDGCSRPLTYNEEESNSFYIRNDMEPRFLGTDFLLKDAYYLQLEEDEKKE